MGKYYLVKDGRIDIKTSYDEGGLQDLLASGELRRDDLLSDCMSQRRAGEFEFLFPKNERRIGIYGKSGSGKTVWLACCTQYGKPFENGALVVPEDRLRGKTVDGMKTLRSVWKNLSRSDAPEPPKKTQHIQNVDFALAHAGMSWNIRTIDYDGGLLDDGNSTESKCLRTWLRDADGIFYLIDASDNSFEIRHLHRFLLSLQDDAEKRALPVKPLAVLLTQQDRDADTINPDALSQTLDAFRFPTCVFPLSAFGTHDVKNDRLPSSGGPCPTGVSDPLLWMAGEIDRILWESIRARWNDRDHGTSNMRTLRLLRSGYSGELGRFGGGVDRQIRRRLVEIDDRLGFLRRRRLSRQILVWGVLLLSVGLFLAASIGKYALFDDDVRYQRIADRIDHAADPEEVERAIQSYRSVPFFFPVRRLDELRRRAEEKIRELRFEDACSRLDLALRHAISFEETKWLYDGFLQRHPVDEYPEYADKIKEYVDERERIIDEERQGIRFLPPTAYAEKIKRIDERLKAFNRNDFRREEFVGDRNKIAEEWDRDDYRRFYDVAKRLKTAGELKHAAELATSYLAECEQRDRFRIESRFRKEVEAWTNLFEELKNEHSLTFELKTIEIPRSFFEDPKRESKIKISLQIGSVKEQSQFMLLDPEQRDSDPVVLRPDLRCVVDRAMWNERRKTLIRLVVTESWGWLGGARAECAVSDSPYPYLDFSPPPAGIFVFPIGDDRTILVETGLRGFSLPELPAPE